MDSALDGNAAGGILHEIFPFEMTTAEAICDHCSANNEVGALSAYMHGMGTTLRCPHCNGALIRIAYTPGHYWLDMHGTRVLQIKRF